MAGRGQTHPVIHFRFNELRTESVEAFEADLTEYVKGRAPVGHALDDIPKAEAIRACGPRISARRWADVRPIWLIGLSFDSRTRHLVECAAEKF